MKNAFLPTDKLNSIIFAVVNILTAGEKSDMEPVDLTELYKMGLKFQLLSKIRPGDKFKDHRIAIESVVYLLYHFLREPKLSLSLCLHEMKEIQKALAKWCTYEQYGDVDWDSEEADSEATFHERDVRAIREAYAKFENVLFAELRKIHIYSIPSKWIYDTDKLLFSGEQIIPEDIRAIYSPDLEIELKAFTRCFAINVFTAAGFHLYRALEIILRDYYLCFVGALPMKQIRSWGIYINDLEKHGTNADIIKKWRNLKDEQRNEIMHPDMSFAEEDVYDIISDFHKLVKGTTVDIMKKKDPNSPLTKMLL